MRSRLPQAVEIVVAGDHAISGAVGLDFAPNIKVCKCKHELQAVFQFLKEYAQT